MKTMINDNRGLPPEVTAHVRAVLEEQNQGVEERCRRYRRWAAARRCVMMVPVFAFLAAGTLKVAGAIVSRPSTAGVLGSQDAIESVQQILIRQ